MEDEKRFFKLKAKDEYEREPILCDDETLYKTLHKVVDRYIDMNEDDKEIAVLWDMAVRNRDSFPTFPELNINGSKSSGKTRFLKLTNALLFDSILSPDMSSASLFRLANDPKVSALLFDEIEYIGSKEKRNLRALLNACYKKAGVVYRVEKRMVDKVERLVNESYEVYKPVVLANIYGLEDVLEDRCISIIMRKSNREEIINRLELFELDEEITFCNGQLRGGFGEDVNEDVQKVKKNVVKTLLGRVYMIYNTFITLPSPSSPSGGDEDRDDVVTALTSSPNTDPFLQEIINSKISGRAFELWLPLFITANFINIRILQNIIRIAKEKVVEHQEEELMEDSDTYFALFLFNTYKTESDFIPIKKMKSDYEIQEGEKKWFNNQWVGHFLRRANIILLRSHTRRGNEVKLDLPKLESYLRVRGVLPEAQEEAPATSTEPLQIQQKVQEPIVLPAKDKFEPFDKRVIGTCAYCKAWGDVIGRYEGNTICEDCLKIEQEKGIG